MARMGRNELCDCGSGLKYKKCCLYKDAEAERVQAEERIGEADAGGQQVIHAAVAQAQKAAKEQRQVFGVLGVLVLFSTSEGDAWLLEVTEKDALQLSAKGTDIEVVIHENPDTTEIEWSHTFSLKDGSFVVTSYKDKAETEYDTYPVQGIAEMIDKITAAMPAGMADMVHTAREE